MPKSKPYHEFLIAQLKEPSFAALYLETHFELEEGEEPDASLMKLALDHVAEALGEDNMTSEEATLHRQKLNDILSDSGVETIYYLGEWLQKLGLKLTVTVAKKQEVSGENVEKVSVV
ncbi:transcriptional regulator [Ancylothrix sp. C2]|uniref:helix-turn-helix domain-containing transcriptional regulator n=1 Tax=Ancylothrix sp. D3o TaxID=2953691 RepID=UPI0021BB0D37|nr:transcriptional regulator [Ancylothrix sp. D3o]MCT7949824.1 transcriptional regulator [Ancylothrix sp. D3o]